MKVVIVVLVSNDWLLVVNKVALRVNVYRSQGGRTARQSKNQAHFALRVCSIISRSRYEISRLHKSKVNKEKNPGHDIGP